jgi:hypothetical protein
VERWWGSGTVSFSSTLSAPLSVSSSRTTSSSESAGGLVAGGGISGYPSVVLVARAGAVDDAAAGAAAGRPPLEQAHLDALKDHHCADERVTANAAMS